MPTEAIPTYEYNSASKNPLTSIDIKSTGTPCSSNSQTSLLKRARSEQENEEDLFLKNLHFGNESILKTPK